MPRLDKTGPEGKGSGTGRGLGLCNTAIEGVKEKLTEIKQNLGRGRGPGRGPGAFGPGRGRRRFGSKKTDGGSV